MQVTMYAVDGRHILQDIADEDDLTKKDTHINNMLLKSINQQQKTKKSFIFEKDNIPVAMVPAKMVAPRIVNAHVVCVT
jgi:hypothetical protein